MLGDLFLLPAEFPIKRGDWLCLLSEYLLESHRLERLEVSAAGDIQGLYLVVIRVLAEIDRRETLLPIVCLPHFKVCVLASVACVYDALGLVVLRISVIVYHLAWNLSGVVSGLNECHGVASQVVVEIDGTDLGATAAHRRETGDIFGPYSISVEVPRNLGVASFALMCSYVDRPVGDLPIHSPKIQDLPDVVVVEQLLEILAHHGESPHLFDGDVG